MISIALIQPNVIQKWEQGDIERISCLVNKNIELNRFKLVNNVANADMIILLESCTFKTQKDIKYFESILYLNNGNKRLCTLNYEDAPPGFLPGLYSSLEAFKFDPAIHLSWPHLVFPNEKINEECMNEDLHVNILLNLRIKTLFIVHVKSSDKKCVCRLPAKHSGTY